MSKEVIYIDINDDITSLVEKIKKSPEKIVALIPAKEIGLLQSVINLQLLAKISKKAGKYLVIITSKESLIKLAGIAKIPIAKTLQSKPILTKPPVSSNSATEEFIDGEMLPVGDLAKMASGGAVTTDEVIVDPNAPVDASTTDKKLIKVPSVNKFRKKFLIFGGLGLALIVFLVWAVAFAPRADIVIQAQSKLVNVDSVVNLTQNSNEVDVAKNIIHAQIQEISKIRTLDFAATGTKNVGVPASGKMTLTNKSLSAKTVPAGSGFSSGDCTFVTGPAVTIPAPTGDILDITPGKVTVTVTAIKPGSVCNLGTRDYQSSVTGVSAQGSDMGGGTDKVAKVVVQDDIDQATQKLTGLGDDNAKVELKNKFDPSAMVIDESLMVDQGVIKSSIAVDIEAPDGKAVLEQPVSYKLTAVVRKQLVEYVSQTVLKDNKSNQKIYETGDNQIQFASFKADDSGASVKVITQVKVGPNISINEVKEFSKGKTFGEVQTKYEAVEGIKQVDVTFRPIWVRRVPNNINRINVEIKP